MLRTTLTHIAQSFSRSYPARTTARVQAPHTLSPLAGQLRPYAQTTYRPKQALRWCIASTSRPESFSTTTSPTTIVRLMSSSTSNTTPKDASRRSASGFPYFLDVQTRFGDNDMYGHVNNAVYGYASDAAINAYLIDECGLEPYPEQQQEKNQTNTFELTPRDVIGLMISTSAIFYAPATFPNILRVGLRVIKLGSSSVLFEMGIFELNRQVNTLKEKQLACAVTRATHVYVDRLRRRPVRPMPKRLSDGLSRLRVGEFEVVDGREGKI